jgi:ArsR family transcriptional regulator
MKGKIEKKMENAIRVADILKNIAHPTRLMIVCLLKEREMFAQEILEALGTTKGNISQHLKILLLNQIISSRHEANRIYYSLKDEALYSLMEYMEKHYCKTH